MRPLEQSARMTARDVTSLSSIRQRVLENESRSPKVKEEIVKCLDRSIELLLRDSAAADKTERRSGATAAKAAG